MHLRTAVFTDPTPALDAPPHAADRRRTVRPKLTARGRTAAERPS